MELRVNMSKRFLWSNIALGVGWFMFLGGLGAIASRVQDPTVETNIHPFLGLQVILGVLAYRSAKRTKLGLREKSFERTGLEIGALVLVWHANILLIVMALLFGKYNRTLLHELYYDPAVPLSEHIIIPVWTLINYIGIRRENANTDQDCE